MSKYQMRIEVKIAEVPDVEGDMAIDAASGFAGEWLLDAKDAESIDAMDSALHHGGHHVLRMALARHLESLSKKKPS